MRFMVLTSLAFTAGQFWIAAQSWWRSRRLPSSARRVAALTDIPPGGVVTFTYPGPEDNRFLVRMPDGELLAYGQECTHLACAVRPLVEQGVIQCPCHNGYFDLRTGRPIAGPPRRPLPVVRLEVRANEIFATGVEERSV
jgi:nitrite reductase/ring-hydroxylating ferredoxin subunit